MQNLDRATSCVNLYIDDLGRDYFALIRGGQLANYRKCTRRLLLAQRGDVDGTIYRDKRLGDVKEELMLDGRYYVGPPRPPSLEDYDYMRTLRHRDWAWEGLRRDPAYQEEARADMKFHQYGTRLENGALLTRMHEVSPRAEAWALRSFR